MTFGSLFAGIGGLDLGLKRAGMVCKWQVEIDPYCRAVLEKHWPDVLRWDDATTFPPDTNGGEQEQSITKPGSGGKAEPIELGTDLICGGFPCQPFSVAGRRRGKADSRNLWPEMLRVVDTLRPRWVLGENTPGLGDYLDEISDGLEACGYEVLPLEIPAAAFEAWHERFRLFIVAYAPGARTLRLPAGSRRERQRAAIVAGARQATTDASSPGRANVQRFAADARSQRNAVFDPGRWWATEPGVVRVVHGIPHRLDRVRAIGNAVVPQVAEWIGRRILEAETLA